MSRVRSEARGFAGAFRPRLDFWTSLASVLPDFTMSSLRSRLYRLGGCDVRSRATIMGRVTFVGPGDVASRLHIGEGSLIAPNVTFGLDASITIGKNVSISPHATFYTATHDLGFGSQRMRPGVSAKAIVIEDGAWVGAHCLVLPGVRLGRGCVVSAGSVVTEDVPPHTLVAGNPAVVKKTLPLGDR